MELVLAQSALDDLQDLQTYNSEQGVRDIIEAIQRLVDHPDSGRTVPEFNQEQIREVIFPPYRVVYLREASSISVIRIWREERELLLPDDET